MTVAQMREALMEAYPGPNWRRRVLYEMPEEQVTATYLRLSRAGELYKHDKWKRKEPSAKERGPTHIPPAPEVKEEQVQQLSIFDYMK